MRKIPLSKSGFISFRNLISVMLVVIGASMAMFSLAATPTSGKKAAQLKTTLAKASLPAAQPAAATPPSGVLDPSNPSVNYTDGPTAPNPTGILGAPDCTVPNSCSDFVVTVNASSLAATHNVTWLVQWTPPNVDLDIFVEDAAGNLVANNNSTADPSAIILPIPPNGTVYHLVVVASVGTAPLNGSISLTRKFPAAQQGAGAPPRYLNYPAAPDQANGDNEPSMGVDWNPNVPGLTEISGQTRKNTGGVAFFTADTDQFRSNFDDCSSPAVNVWEDMNAPIVTGLDPIGFVDHFSTQPLGLGPNPPKTPGRIFGLDLAAGTSTAAFSDDDGNSWTSIVAGNYPAGPDHETLGGGPFHAPIPTPPAPLYPNAIYYCSQNGAQGAECSRSDDGGVTFGPGVPIFDPTVCGGGIHGHAKVSPQGTVYVPNSSCGAGNPVGTNGAAVSKDNGLTWAEMNVPGSTGSQDPAIGIGQNNVGKPSGQVPNTVYLGWISGDGHAHVAHSPDEGATWHDDTDISSIIGSEKAVFPVVVAGDDNRAAFGFLGTDPDFPNKQVWHLYVATTYTAGQSWILVDATPDDPVQIGDVCLLGIGCSGARNLLDFNGIDVDKEGRVLLGYTDGCVNCANTQNITQSSQGHGTIARQSGGRRLFSAFDPVEPAPPAAPQLVSAVRQNSTNVQLSWLTPDNGGSPITGYNIYRSNASGSEIPYAHVEGALTNKFVDQAAPTSSNWYYRVTAVNLIGEGTYCRELNVDGVQPGETACQLPYITVNNAGHAGTVPQDPTSGEMTIQRVAIGEPFSSCADKSVTFLMKVQSLSPAPPPNAEWQVLFNVPDTNGTTRTIFVEAQTQDNPAVVSYSYGYRTTSPTGGNLDVAQGPAKVTGSANADGTILMKLDVSGPLVFNDLTSVHQFDVNIPVGTNLTNITGFTYLLVGAAPGGTGGGVIENVSTSGPGGPYKTIGNLGCLTARPLAALTATPMSGPAPLNVTFSAAASSNPNPCTTIAAYTLDFGDGTAPVTHTVAQLGASASQFSHTYNSAGDHAARLTVTDSAGQVSNPAKTVVSVSSNRIELVGVVSRKAHGSQTFDYTLPSDGSGIECRNKGDSVDRNVDYQLVFVFPNSLSNPGGISVAATATGDVQPNHPTGGAGADSHQYIVNLTGVPNAQHLTVTLSNVQDSSGATGNVSASMGVLIGDVNRTGRTDAGDQTLVRNSSVSIPTSETFGMDVNCSGRIDAGDLTITRNHSVTVLP